MILRCHHLALASVLVATPSLLAGQAGAARSLGRPTHAPAAEFTSVAWVVELRPGLLLVGDATAHGLTSLDLASGRSGSVARSGSGPREYRVIGEHVLPRPGGGAFVIDFVQRRLLPVLPDGSVADVIPYPPQLLLQQADASGRWYAEIMRFGPNRAMSDSVSIVRWDPRSQRVDTLLTFDAGRSAMVSQGGPLPVWYASASWSVSPDGAITVVRSAPYQMRTWRNGSWTAPVSLAWPNRAPSPAEIAAKRAELAAQPVRGMGGGADGTPPRRVERTFPARLPAFEAFTPLRRAPDGTFWVLRLEPSRKNALYDVIGSTGLLGQVTLPAGSTVVGFGPGGVYVAEPDADEVLRVRRYGLPVWP
ncbi:MAG TPA: hypothetical protein PLJ23_01690 [Gemmatimonadales bacterium]|nr:hypothetical protein [Gemmatimonadales bacterium]